MSLKYLPCFQAMWLTSKMRTPRTIATRVRRSALSCFSSLFMVVLLGPAGYANAFTGRTFCPACTLPSFATLPMPLFFTLSQGAEGTWSPEASEFCNNCPAGYEGKDNQTPDQRVTEAAACTTCTLFSSPCRGFTPSVPWRAQIMT